MTVFEFQSSADIRTASLNTGLLSENKHHKFERTVNDKKVGQRNKSNEEKLKLLEDTEVEVEPTFFCFYIM